MSRKSFYHRTSEMQTGEFRCPQCKKLMFLNIEGKFMLELVCPRCNAYIKIVTRESIPISKNMEAIMQNVESKLMEEMKEDGLYAGSPNNG